MSVPASARRVVIPAARLGRWLDGYGVNHPGVVAESDGAVVELNSDDGAVAWISVPFPPLPSADDLLAALVAHVERPRRVGVLLVRRGGYAVGVFEGDELVQSKVDSSYVQGSTKAGGWSQKRYSRRRDNQAQKAFEAATETAVRILSADTALAAIVTGGDQRAVQTVLDDPRLAPLLRLVQSPALVVPDPRLRVLQATPEQFRSVRIALSP
ncbi:hypothetical protein SAMN05444157_3563 [Frankineae bacterium MT45]|nr:hypothetical protein SAMN05444157_3563 [Frankineae bacterium MT45]